MPEGDSIHRLARQLAPLIGKPVRAFFSHGIPAATAASVVGHAVTAVEARGKNLLVRFDDGRTLHVHLRMLGRLVVERPRSAFWKPRTTPHQLRLAVDGFAIVGDKIPVLRLLQAGAAARELAALGPDLLLEPEAAFDPAECVARLRTLGARSIGDALLVQRALAGIGNIFKSETLFVEKVDPRHLVRDLSDATLTGLVRTASTLMRQNVRPGARSTRPTLGGPRFSVYRRAGRPCLRCRDGVIVRILQGPAPGRST